MVVEMIECACRSSKLHAISVLTSFFCALLCAQLNAAAGDDPRNASSFELIDQMGRRVTEKTFKGKPSIVFFGFTHCPDICPTTLFDLSNQLQDLGPLADQLNVIFVSVDPERDTPEVLRNYLASFDSRIIGLSGDVAMVGVLAKSLGAVFEKVPNGDNDYVMDHSIMHFLLDREWHRVGLLYARTDGAGKERTLKKLRALIAE